MDKTEQQTVEVKLPHTSKKSSYEFFCINADGSVINAFLGELYVSNTLTRVGHPAHSGQIKKALEGESCSISEYIEGIGSTVDEFIKSQIS